MKIFKVSENAEIPVFATEGSACFDLRACLEEGDKIRAYNPHNKEMALPVKRDSNGKFFTQVQPSFRTLIPTGLIFDIPKGHVVKIYIRSSMALKYGLGLANDTAIIDSDYVDPSYVMVYNMSDTPITIYHGDRIAQAMLEKLHTYTLTERKTAPEQKTERDGGLGSTGVA
jgi:dUTP pyrophosphatase